MILTLRPEDERAIDGPGIASRIVTAGSIKYASLCPVYDMTGERVSVTKIYLDDNHVEIP
jgi:hypothetical protein